MNSKEKNISQYLFNNFKNKFCYHYGKFNMEPRYTSFLEQIEDLFQIHISPEQYSSVCQGEGNEQDKIDRIYSSSLQSLLIFSQISKEKPLILHNTEEKEIKYDNVYFEYKNKVLFSPSSIDVVLKNDEKKELVFIESKLFEIIRDSNKTGEYVVGPSYLSKNGYFKLGLNESDLLQIGLSMKEEKTETEIKDILSQAKEKSPHFAKLFLIPFGKKEDGSLLIRPIGENSYVYSYGIKQILSHYFGIKSFQKNLTHENTDCYLENCRNYQIRFVELYNSLPGYELDDSTQKIQDYLNHVKQVFHVLEAKEKNQEKPIKFSILSYQQLYQMNQEKYFDDSMKSVIDFYHLK